MAETYRFPTNSQYTGSFNKSLHNMEGFGRYTFPDGSEYRGFFHRGKFHGFGRLIMAVPNQFIFSCEYNEGELVRVISMQFPDGLLVDASFEAGGMNFDEWLYCTPDDRRFSNEIALNIEPVGPTANLTASRPTKHLPPGTYDVGGGIFKTSTRFIINIPPPFFRHKFVACDEEAEWIRANCRCGRTDFKRDKPKEPNAAVCRRIIETNIDGLRSVDPCSCRESASRKGYLAKLCRAEKRHSKDESSEPSSVFYPTLSSGSASSVCEAPLVEPIQDKCELEVQGLKINVYSSTTSTRSLLIDPERRASLIAKSKSRQLDPSYKSLWDHF